MKKLAGFLVIPVLLCAGTILWAEEEEEKREEGG